MTQHENLSTEQLRSLIAEAALSVYEAVVMDLEARDIEFAEATLHQLVVQLIARGTNVVAIRGDGVL